MPEIHPFYESHRAAMEIAMRERVALALPLIQSHRKLDDPVGFEKEVMDELEVVIGQMPYVGGAQSRMTDFFMRLSGFIALGRVLRRKGIAPKLIVDIARETYKAQLLSAPETDRLKAGRHFMSAENQAMIRSQAAISHDEKYPGDFVYDFVTPGPGETFEFGVNYRACGFCKFAERHGDRDILPTICGLDFVAYETRGIKLERTQTLAGGGSHCNFRFTSMEPKSTGS